MRKPAERGEGQRALEISGCRFAAVPMRRNLWHVRVIGIVDPGAREAMTPNASSQAAKATSTACPSGDCNAPTVSACITAWEMPYVPSREVAMICSISPATTAPAISASRALARVRVRVTIV